MLKNEIEKTITGYIGDDNVLECSVVIFGHLADVSLLYMDGRPLRVVRRWIEDHVPMLWHLSIDRCYSDEVLNEYGLSEDNEQSIEYAQNRLFNVAV